MCIVFNLVLYQAKLTILPTNITKEGDHVILYCAAESSDVISYAWYKNSVKLQWKQEKRIINNVQRNDNGTYYCVISNALGQRFSEEVVLTVLCK